MRILVVNWFPHVAGGAETYLRGLFPALIKQGHEVALAYAYPLISGRESLAVELPLRLFRLSNQDLEASLSALDSWAPDVAYAHSQGDPNLERALIDRYPSVLFGHNYFGTCSTGEKSFAFPRARPCTRRYGPMCLVLHYPRRCGGLNPLTAWHEFQKQGARNRNLRRYRAIVVASRHMAAEFRNNGVPADRVHQVSLPFGEGLRNTAPPEPRESHGRLLMVGRLTRGKGGEHLLRAIPIAARRLGVALRLTIAGGGPEQARLEGLARRLGVAVDFAGWVDSARRDALMREADLLVIPSVWPEPFGLVGLEAGCVGLPSVSYAVGGITEWLIPGEGGELAPGDPPTPAGLAAAIVRALKDGGHHQRLRRGAWEIVNRFDMASHLARLEPILAAAASEQRTVGRPAVG
ncbi:MAG TPA: glycosyltransferase family 4 protein [Candidatus Binataceae bacterium]|nr:glycosyltransferase family 4 protein [Candidatus Binataceae bacterium]